MFTGFRRTAVIEKLIVKISYRNPTQPTAVFTVLAALATLTMMLLAPTANAQSNRKSLLNSDSEVIYLEEVFDKKLELKVVKPAPLYANKDGGVKLGTLLADQKVEVLAINDKAYRVKGMGKNGGMAGWVGTWAFEMPDENFEKNMQAFYERQMKVKKLIEQGQVVLGMTMAEVEQAKGEPTKTSVRQTKDGQTGRWEFVEYTEVRNYATHIDPYTGQAYRTLVSVTRDETEKTIVEFEDGHVVALEESSSEQGSTRIVLPRVVCYW